MIPFKNQVIVIRGDINFGVTNGLSIGGMNCRQTTGLIKNLRQYRIVMWWGVPNNEDSGWQIARESTHQGC